MSHLEPTPRPHLVASIWTHWSRRRILALAVALLAANFAVQILVYLLDGGLVAPTLAGALLGVVAPLVLLTLSGSLQPVADLGLRRPGTAPMLLAAGIALASVPPVSLLAGWSSRLHPPDPEWLRLVNESMPDTATGLLLAVVAIVLAAPLAEEIVFRALLQRLAAGMWGRGAAAVVTSLIFALAHGEPWYLFGLVGVGLMLAFIWEATRSLWACWAAHALYNGLSLVLMMTAQDVPGEPAPLTWTDGLINGGSVVLLILLGRALLGAGRRAL